MTKKELIKACEDLGFDFSIHDGISKSDNKEVIQELYEKLLAENSKEDIKEEVKEPNYSSVKYIDGYWVSKNGNKFRNAKQAASDY